MNSSMLFVFFSLKNSRQSISSAISFKPEDPLQNTARLEYFHFVHQRILFGSYTRRHRQDYTFFM